MCFLTSTLFLFGANYRLLFTADADTDVTAGGSGASKIEECEVCMKKSVMYGVTVFLVLALVLSLVASCFLFARAHKSRRARDDSEMYNGSANPTFKH